MLSALVRAAKRLHFFVLNTQKLFLVCLFLPLVLTMFAQTMARYVLGIAFFAIEEFVGYSAVWLYFIGAAVATHERTHIKAEMTGMFLKNPRTLSILRAVVAAISVIVAAIMTQWAYDFVLDSVRTGQRTVAYQIPFVYFQVSILVGAFLMAVYFTLELVDNIREAFRFRLPPRGKDA